MPLHIDFETRSEVGLQDKAPGVGLYNYARHHTTGIYCMGYAFGDEPVQIWTEGDAFPERVIEWVNEGGDVIAHNAAFEYELWNHCLRYTYEAVPPLLAGQLHCTRAMGLRMGLPGGLDSLAQALKLDHAKDKEGYALMMRLCKPTAAGDWLTDRESFTFMGKKITPREALDKLYAYCKQDVEVERAIDKTLLPLPKSEQKLFLVDRAINNRGIQLDQLAVSRALELTAHRAASIDLEIRKLTEGEVDGITKLTDLKRWMGYEGSLDKKIVAAKLEYGDSSLSQDAIRALELRAEASRLTSLKKVDAMRRLMGPDGRVRHTTQYHKAGTGRWGGQGLQPHNFPRDLPDDVEELFAKLKAGSEIKDPITKLSQALRGFIVSEQDALLFGGDWSNIEGRMLAWLAGEHWKVKVFEDYDNGIGPDVYVASYASSAKCTIEEAAAHRQKGKIQELALGYQGGLNSLRTFGYEGTDEEGVAVVRAWREAHISTRNYWYRLQDAAVDAVKSPGQMFWAGAMSRRIRFKMATRSGVPYLQARLPSGRQLYYPYPELRPGKYGQQLTYMTVPNPLMKERFLKDPNNISMQWERVSTYGGKLANNVTQACARDILASALIRCEAEKIPAVMHTHDEIVAEVCGRSEWKSKFEKFKEIMNTAPEWAKGLPLVAGCWYGDRYRKG